jgi:hypothetical protein
LEVSLPKRIAMQHTERRKRRALEPLFPGFLFAHVDEYEWLHVFQGPGIIRRGEVGTPPVVDPEEIARLKILQNAPERLAPVGLLPPRVGGKAEVHSGPLKGLTGEVVGHRGRLHVMVRVSAIRQAAMAYVAVHELVGVGAGVLSRTAVSRWPRAAGMGAS